MFQNFPKAKFQQALADIEESKTREDFEACCYRAAGFLGFPTFGYAAIVPNYQRQNFFGNFSEAWKAKYFGGGFQRIDGVIRHCRMSDKAVYQVPVHELLKEIYRHVPGLAVARLNVELYAISCEFGYRNQLAIPTTRAFVENSPRAAIYYSAPGSHDEFCNQVEAFQEQITQLGVVVHKHASGRFYNAYYRITQLNDTELFVMNLLSAGHDVKEIAELLGVQPRAIQKRIKKVQEKFNAKSPLHLIKILAFENILSDDLNLDRGILQP